MSDVKRGRKPKYPELQDRDWLYARYVEDGLSADQVAELIDFDCTYTTVLEWVRRHGIPTREVGSKAPAGRPSWTPGRRASGQPSFPMPQ